MQELETRTWPLDLDPGADVNIEADMASITVVRVEPGQSPRVELADEALKWFDLNVEKHGATTRIHLSMRPNSFRQSLFDWFSPRKGGLTVYLPDALHVRVHAEAGKVCVSELNLESLEVTADAGAVSLRRLTGALRARASAGKIDGDGLSGTIDVQATTGAVRLRLEELDPGEHCVRADVGSVQVELPRGAAVRVITESSLGTARNDFTSAPDAQATLRVEAHVGTVRVHEFTQTTPAPERPAASRPRRSAVAVATKPRTDEEVEHVLKMVEEGVLSAKDAADILKAMEGR